MQSWESRTSNVFVTGKPFKKEGVLSERDLVVDLFPEFVIEAQDVRRAYFARFRKETDHLEVFFLNQSVRKGAVDLSHVDFLERDSAADLLGNYFAPLQFDHVSSVNPGEILRYLSRR